MKKLIVICAACGVGKSTVKDEINNKNLIKGYVGIDTDEVGINWWDYEGTDHESKFSDDCLAEAVRMSVENNLIRVLQDTFLNFKTYYGFQAVFCNLASGNKKGMIENLVKYTRNNYFVPTIEFESYDILIRIFLKLVKNEILLKI